MLEYGMMSKEPGVRRKSVLVLIPRGGIEANKVDIKIIHLNRWLSDVMLHPRAN